MGPEIKPETHAELLPQTINLAPIGRLTSASLRAST
jgi:hypothetical protein